MQDKHMNSAYWALRVAFGVVPIVAGLDKFTNLLTSWDMYLSPLAARVLPVSPAIFMRACGVVEVVVGAAILLGHARVFGWVAMAWLAAIAMNLIASGNFLDVAARDAVMAVGAFALAQLAQVHEHATHELPEKRGTPAHAGA
jgi:uncharacterized membrane protein YphA (DoxX/SURF4 family)